MTRILTAALLSLLAPSFAQPAGDGLRQVGSIALPGVEGRFDHFAVDVEGRRLFVAALGNNTLEVIDLDAMRPIGSVGGLHEPQGVRYLPQSHQVVVANGGDGAIVFLNRDTLKVARTVKLSGDADNVRYDAGARRVYVGYGNGALSVLEPDGTPVADIRLAAHPESFQLESNGARIFVNVPDAGHIAVVDRDRKTAIATWPVTQARANYPMALDEARHRLFIGCRTPARLLVYDTTSGRLVAAQEIPGDTDDLFYDPARQRIYVAGGEGFISVLQQQDADHYSVVQKVPTAPGARTALFVPEMSRLFLAVPHRGAQRAEIRVYEIPR